MSFSNPEVFFFLLVLPFAVYASYRSFLKGRTELLRLGGEWRGYRLESVYVLKSFLTNLFLMLAFTFMIAAWAGPSWGATPVEEPQSGLDVALCVDVSRSMLATDAAPSRLEQAREAVRFLIKSFPNARFSLVAFKGTGITLTPLSPDTGNLEKWVEELSPSLTTAPGSNMESGIAEALRTVNFPTARHKVIILISDGENKDGDLVRIARMASDKNVGIYSFGVGTSDGATIPFGESQLMDDFGNPVRTHLNEGTLELVSRESGGKYFGPPNRLQLRDLQTLLTSLSNPAARGGVKLEEVPQYRFFLFLALASFLGFLIVRIVPSKGGF